jgi:OFA family oxalate/formate antiporter-like MFS transporter
MSSVPKNLTRERLLALIACLLITFCMGTIHAFSTLIQNIEIQTSVGRMASSFVYSIALVNVTLAVFFGHILYRKLSPNLLISLIAILPLIGLFFSSLQSWLGWVIGYGFLFGLSSGLGYGLSLFIVSSITERDKLGYALGLVTASYAFGAVAFSMAYPFLFSYLGFKNGYIIGLVTLTLIVMVALICYKVSKVNIKNELNGDNQIQSKSQRLVSFGLVIF